MDWRDAPPAQFAVLGDPVSHSQSPRMHQAYYDAESLDLRYVALRVPVPEFDLAVSHLYKLGYQGLNVTVPLKEIAAKSNLVIADPFSSRVAAVNTLSLRGGPPFPATNTDAPGFLRTLIEAGISPPGPILVLGAGGSARAIVTALDDAGYEVQIWNRTPKRVPPLIEELNLSRTKLYISGSFESVVNSTSSSLAGEAPPVEWDLIGRPVAIDLMYSDALSPFLKAAAARGLTLFDGRELLAAQGALSAATWLGVPPPFAVMRAALGERPSC